MALAEAHVADLDEFLADPSRHLRAAWRRDMPLLVLIEGRRRIEVETLDDLELVHYTARRIDREGTREADDLP